MDDEAKPFLVAVVGAVLCSILVVPVFGVSSQFIVFLALMIGTFIISTLIIYLIASQFIWPQQ